MYNHYDEIAVKILKEFDHAWDIEVCVKLTAF